MRTPGQGETEIGAIHHASIGRADIDDASVAATPVEVAMNGAPRSSVHNKGRRRFLEWASGIVAGAAVPGMASAKIFTEEEMRDLDKNRERLIQKDGGDEMFLGAFNPEGKPTEAKIKEYINSIVSRSERSKLGVHMQRHENAMWLIEYFNEIVVNGIKGRTDKRVLYYPAKVGFNSKFVADFLRDIKAKNLTFKTQKIEDPYAGVGSKAGKTRELEVYLKEGERLEQTLKPRAVLAFVDTGWAYVILPAKTHVIFDGDKKFIAACRNPIHATLSDCPDAK